MAVGAEGLLPPPQTPGVPGFQAAGGTVYGNVGAAFKDDAHHAHGHPDFFDPQAVGAQRAALHDPYRVVQLDELSHPVADAADPVFRQGQTVDEAFGEPVFPTGFYVLVVCFQNFFPALPEDGGDDLQTAVFLRRAGFSDNPGGFLAPPA